MKSVPQPIYWNFFFETKLLFFFCEISHTVLILAMMIYKMSYKILNLNYLFMFLNNLQLRKKKGMACEREIKQFHYTSWPDHGVIFFVIFQIMKFFS
jgi:protein tyrosine phosphatase